MSMLSQNILVTGASGFIGLHLCRELLKRGCDVHAVCRSEPKIKGSSLRWHPVDLSDAKAARKVLAEVRAEVVFHLCSYAQGERDLALVLPTFQGELQTTVNVLTSVAEIGCRKIVMAGSLEESDADEVPSSPYAAAKAASRMYTRMFHQLYYLPVVMTRIFMTYGPGQSAKKLIRHSIETLLRAETLKIASPGRKVDWIYVEDVVRGLLAAAVAPNLEGKSVDLGSGQLVEIRSVVSRIQELANPKAVVEFGALPPRDNERVCCAEVERTHALTGWRPSISLDEGLKHTIDFLVQTSGRT